MPHPAPALRRLLSVARGANVPEQPSSPHSTLYMFDWATYLEIGTAPAPALCRLLLVVQPTDKNRHNNKTPNSSALFLGSTGPDASRVHSRRKAT
jgi:hypothetical protein